MNKKLNFGISLIIALLLVFGAAAPVFAQTVTPPDPGVTHQQQGQAAWLASVATALQMSVDDLKTALKGGKTVADLAKEKGLDLNSLISTVSADQAKQIQQAVSDGKLTQDQADQRLAQMKTDLNEWFVTGKIPDDIIIKRNLAQADKTIADALGMSVQDLNAAIKGGKTVTQLAQEKGVDMDTLVNDVTAKRTQALQKSVQSGKMTQDQADKLLATFKQGITEWLQTGKAPKAWKAVETVRNDKTTIATDLGMSLKDMTDAIKSGKTVAQLAQEKGISLDSIISSLTSAANDKIQQALKSGKITQDQADKRLSNLKDRLTNRLQNGPRTKNPKSGKSTPQPGATQPAGTGSGI